MAKIPGYEALARALHAEGCKAVFFIMGNPITEIAERGRDMGMKAIDVRHEQAATFMAHGYSRITTEPGVVISAAGPGSVNAGGGLVHAAMDCVPVIQLGGSGPLEYRERGAFQEYDQVAMMKPIAKWTCQVLDARRFPELLHLAYRYATNGRPGPVYLDCPADVLHSMVEEDEVGWVVPDEVSTTSYGDPAFIARAAELLINARRPIVVGGSGLVWSKAGKPLAELIERLEIPFYTTPQARGVVPDDHPLSYPEARSTAFHEADVVLVLGTRDNYVMWHFLAPRFAEDAKIISVNVDRADIGRVRRVAVGIVGDVGAVLGQIKAEVDRREALPNTKEWRAQLSDYVTERRKRNEERMATDVVPIHPLRLCKEVRDFMDRSAILATDGHVTLNYARQSIPFYMPHSLTAGTAGWMGVGVPMGIGAQVARPEVQTIVMTGDGAFGLNGMEIDTAVRHNLPVLIIVNNNGRWGSASARVGGKIGRYLGFSGYEKIAHAFGGYGERVERPEDIRPALERAKASGVAAIINVVTEPAAAADTTRFMAYDFV